MFADLKDPLDIYNDEHRGRGLYISHALYDAIAHELRVTLHAGVTIVIPKDRAQVMAHVDDGKLLCVEVSPAGWAVDFPDIDDGISLASIVALRFGSERWEESWAEHHRDPRAA